ncbi:MAG: sialidase family protein [Candidatus Limnocylindrales bacterium]
MSRRPAKRVATFVAVVGWAVSVLFLDPGSLVEANDPTESTPVEEATLAPDATPWAPSPAPAQMAVSLQQSPPSPLPSAAATPTPTAATPTPAPSPRVLADINAVPSVGTRFPSDSVTEPTVAASPFDPSLVALVYQRLTSSSSCGLDTGISISRDGGRTWKAASGRPWAGTRRGPNYHGVIAWGPGPSKGSSRLWWADTTVPSCNYTAHSVSVSYSDDFGKTWAPLYVERRTPPWIGGYPDITVDTNPASPNFGVVYVAYNWLASAQTGPGLAVLASGNGGKSWQMAEVAAVGLRGYPASWRIGYRVRTAPDGSAYVAFYEADMRRWNSRQPFASGGLNNVGRIGFAVTQLQYDRVARRLAADPAVWAITLARNAYTVIGAAAPGTNGVLSPEPKWQIGFDIDRSTGRVLLAVSDYASSVSAGHAHGVIRVGHSDGGDWYWETLAALPPIEGRPQSSFKPTLAARDGVVFVGFHGLTDIPAGIKDPATVGTYYAVSYDSGGSFTAPARISARRWNPNDLATDSNGPGLRERADLGADGIIRFAYGDGRLAARYPGRSAVFVAIVDPGVR